MSQKLNNVVALSKYIILWYLVLQNFDMWYVSQFHDSAYKEKISRLNSSK